MPIVATTPALLALLVIGALLYAFGGGLARGGFLFTASLLGYVAGSFTASLLELSVLMTFVIALLSSIVAFAAARVLFRFWIGLTSGLLLAICMPLLALTFLPAPEPTEQQVEQAAQTLQAEQQLAYTSLYELTPAQKELARETAKSAYVHVRTAIQAIWQRESAPFQEWWGTHSADRKKSMGTLALVSGLFGLALGLLWPLRAIALQTSAVGAVLIFVTGCLLLERFAPNVYQYIPQQDFAVGLLLVVMIVVGFGLQRGEASPKCQPKKEGPEAQAA